MTKDYITTKNIKILIHEWADLENLQKIVHILFPHTSSLQVPIENIKDDLQVFFHWKDIIGMQYSKLNESIEEETFFDYMLDKKGIPWNINNYIHISKIWLLQEYQWKWYAKTANVLAAYQTMLDNPQKEGIRFEASKDNSDVFRTKYWGEQSIYEYRWWQNYGDYTVPHERSWRVFWLSRQEIIDLYNTL